MTRLLILSLSFLLILTDPAHAGVVGGLLAAGKAFLASGTVAALAAKAALQLVVGRGLSLLAQRLRGKPEQPGIENQFQGRNASDADGFGLGRHAVKGHRNWHGASGDNNKWYHEVVELGGLPGATLERLIIDGEYSDLGDDYSEGSDVFGKIIVSKNKDSDNHRAFIKYYDGTQTVADPMLVARCGTGDHAWTADHKLQGKPYAILSYYFDRKRFPRGVPDKTYEMMSIPLYDPRKDSSVGGSGAHRWNDPDTWEQSENPVVLIYNIMRGITAPNGAVWGGACDAEDLPLPNWIAAMNACDVVYEGRPKYRAGLYVKWTDIPADIVRKFLSACGGQMVDQGGTWYISVDAPETATVTITDDDVLVSEPSERKPFPGLEGTFNGVTLTFPDPALLWNANPDFTYRNATWVAEDGGERIADLKLEACSYPEQGKQLARALAEDNRRFLGHRLPLPPEYSVLRPLNTLAYDSAFNGYSNKLFEIGEMAKDLRNFNSTLSVRERDPNDWTPLIGLELPSLPTAGAVPRPDAGLPGFDIVPVTVDDGNGNRRITFKLIWNAAAIEDTVAGLAYQLRLTGTEELILNGDIADVSEGVLFLPGDYIPGTGYDARGKALSRVRDTDWTPWISETAPAVSDQVRIVQLSTGAQVFTYDASGANPSPANTTFTASVRGAVSTPYFEWFVDDVSQGAASTTATFAYTPKASASAMPDVVRVEMRDGGPTEDVVATDRITVIGLVPGEQAVSMILTNEAHTVPAANNGSGEDLSGAFTDVAVYVGTDLDTANWTINKIDSADVNASLSGIRVTVTDLDADTGWVDITASRAGFDPITKRFSLSKSRVGDQGSDGKSTFRAIVYRRSASQPPTPFGGSFNFGTNALSPPSGWNSFVPNGSNPVWASSFVFSVIGNTGIVNAGSWSTPIKVLENGTSGDRGAGRWWIGVSSLPSTSLADNRWNDGVGNHPARPAVGDQAIFYTGSLANPTGTRAFICSAVYSDTSHAWTQQVRFVDGNMTIAGTLTLDKLAFFQSGSIEVSNGQIFVRSRGITSALIGLNAVEDANIGNNQVVNRHIDDNAVDTPQLASLSVTKADDFQDDTPGGLSELPGNGGWRNVIPTSAIAVPGSTTASILFLTTFQQGYTAGARSWGFRLYGKLGSTSFSGSDILLERSGMNAISDFPTVQTIAETINAVGSTFYYIRVDWFGQDSTIRLQKVITSTFFRYR